jgi:hypothetical protein
MHRDQSGLMQTHRLNQGDICVLHRSAEDADAFCLRPNKAYA